MGNIYRFVQGTSQEFGPVENITNDEWGVCDNSTYLPTPLSVIVAARLCSFVLTIASLIVRISLFYN